MYIKRHCKLCGNVYWTGNGKSKYCSDKCRGEAHKQQIKEWLAKHPDYHKKWRESHPEYFKEYARCIKCGQQFASDKTPKQYCHHDCYAFKKNIELKEMIEKDPECRLALEVYDHELTPV